MSSNVNKLMFMVMTEKSLDISDFFPIRSLKKLDEFMDRSHPDFKLRLKEFKQVLVLAIDPNVKKFADALLAALFSRDILAHVKWPSAG